MEVLDRADELELGNLIDEVQVVQALEAIAVALMNRIDSHVTGLSDGCGRRRSPIATCTGRVETGVAPRRR